MSLAKNIAASKKAAKAEAAEAEKREAFNNRYIAKTIMKAKKDKSEAFASNEIESLQEIALLVVADNFDQYPDLEGIKDEKI